MKTLYLIFWTIYITIAMKKRLARKMSLVWIVPYYTQVKIGLI
jgi:hypothetical protein